jgi:hypothetical protein
MRYYSPMFAEIPTVRPATPLLDAVDAGRSIRDLSEEELN